MPSVNPSKDFATLDMDGQMARSFKCGMWSTPILGITTIELLLYEFAKPGGYF